MDEKKYEELVLNLKSLLNEGIISQFEYQAKMSQLDKQKEVENISEHSSVETSSDIQTPIDDRMIEITPSDQKKSSPQPTKPQKSKIAKIIGIVAACIVVIVGIVYFVYPCLFVGHNYTSAVTQKPTCGTDGVETFECNKCHNSYTQPVSATGNHDWDSGKIIQKPTCGDMGSREFTCKICGASKTEKIPATLKHKFGDWYIAEEATYSNAGSKKQTCKICGFSNTETIPVKDHKDELIVDTNGKQLWKVYVEEGTLTFSGTFSGSGYFGVTVLDSNQDFEELIVNEVGSYVLEGKSVYVGAGWHYIQLECTDGSYSVSWAGTGGH